MVPRIWHSVTFLIKIYSCWYSPRGASNLTLCGTTFISKSSVFGAHTVAASNLTLCGIPFISKSSNFGARPVVHRIWHFVVYFSKQDRKFLVLTPWCLKFDILWYNFHIKIDLSRCWPRGAWNLTLRTEILITKSATFGAYPVELWIWHSVVLLVISK